MSRLAELTFIIRGAGDLATGVALRLYRAGFRKLLLLETPRPLAVRRQVAFAEAVYEGEVMVEDVRAVLVREGSWPNNGEVFVCVDPEAGNIARLRPEVVIDAIMAKQPTGTRLADAPLVVGLGPGFSAGRDVHCVIETMRGHGLGRVIHTGEALADTGVPGALGGYTRERLLRAPGAGLFVTSRAIGDQVAQGDRLGTVAGVPVHAGVGGVIRGLLRSHTPVDQGTKLGDIDPRNRVAFCRRVSDKALAIGGGVLEAVLSVHQGSRARHQGKIL